MDKLALFRKIIIANELGGNMKLAYQFSDADGVRTGKSGYSFGMCQFDINNNSTARMALRGCGFSESEITNLRSQVITNMDTMNTRLEIHSNIIDKWDNIQLNGCVDWVTNLCFEIGATFDTESTILHIADYHNQFFMSKGGKMYSWLQGIQKPVSPQDILNFKLSLPWGQKVPKDVHRRFNNIVEIVKEGAS